jgi:SAM-dependent methyltransferase
MENQNDARKYIKDLKKKIRNKAKTYNKDGMSKKNTPGLSLDLQKNNMNDIYNFLDEAEKNSRVGLNVPEFNQLFVLKRITYRLIIKFLFKILKVVTINQRQFNLSILDALRSVINDYNNLKLRFAGCRTQLDTGIIELKAKLEQKDIEIDELKNVVNYLKNSLIQMEKRIKSIPEGVKQDVEKIRKDKLQDLTDEISYDMDSLYVFLEDNLRGSCKEIKERFKVYVPIIKKANAGTKNSPVLDIGCGRGEWLELLKEKNLYARGLDSNKVMVKICKERGLDVTDSDAFSFIKNVYDNSLGAVTGFHLIEHYGFDFLIKLLDEILRVLKPGGLVILETPNPGNVLVGSCSFYLDPTHNKPIPSSLIKLVLESRGFSKVRIMNINPFKDDFKIKEDDSETSKRFNDYFYGPQDYAVVGFKI